MSFIYSFSISVSFHHLFYFDGNETRTCRGWNAAIWLAWWTWRLTQVALSVAVNPSTSVELHDETTCLWPRLNWGRSSDSDWGAVFILIFSVLCENQLRIKICITLYLNKNLNTRHDPRGHSNQFPCSAFAFLSQRWGLIHTAGGRSGAGFHCHSSTFNWCFSCTVYSDFRRVSASCLPCIYNHETPYEELKEKSMLN